MAPLVFSETNSYAQKKLSKLSLNGGDISIPHHSESSPLYLVKLSMVAVFSVNVLFTPYLCPILILNNKIKKIGNQLRFKLKKNL